MVLVFTIFCSYYPAWDEGAWCLRGRCIWLALHRSHHTSSQLYLCTNVWGISDGKEASLLPRFLPLCIFDGAILDRRDATCKHLHTILHVELQEKIYVIL